jgi:hypothetical protein
MQTVGTICKICGQSIILSTEGKSCALCGTAVHLGCDPRDSCAACGHPYQMDKRSEPDPLRDAVLPRTLRPIRSGGPALAISVGVAFLLLGAIIWFALEYILPRGH